jgi:dTDP-4-amino-4,6-dideoxygalactose transaminase
LERAIADFHDTPHVTLCCSGTVAVELALRGANVRPGDEVLLAGYDFPGNFRAIEAVGARPALVDLAPRSWCLDAGLLEAAIGPDTRAIVVSHLHGTLAPMDRIMAVARARNVAVVEDACQSPGAMIAGRRAGAWGDVGVLSFGGSKLLTAGRGGALLTSSPEIHQRIKVFVDRGNQAFPLSELQAAVLLPQLAKLLDRNETRSRHVAQFTAALAGLPLQFAAPAVAGDQPAYYKLAAQFDGGGRVARDQILAAFAEHRLPFDAGFRGFALRGSKRCRQATDLPNCRAAATDTILLHHPVLLGAPETIAALADETRKVLAAFA